MSIFLKRLLYICGCQHKMHVMYRIEYEISLNESGRPCIDLPQDYENRPEDRFFAIEMARYFLQGTRSRMTLTEYNQHTIDTMDVTIRMLGQIGDEVAEILWNGMISMGEIDMMFDKRYHFTVDTIEDRDNIKEYTISDNKIYKRWDGLKVLVASNSTIYELKNEIWWEVTVKNMGSSEKNEGE